jgi:hypothetical protein
MFSIRVRVFQSRADAEYAPLQPFAAEPHPAYSFGRLRCEPIEYSAVIVSDKSWIASE